MLSRYNPTVISNEKEFNYFRSLSAFNVGLFGEASVYTTRKVTNHQSYIAKCDFFTPDLQPHANFIPGFMFLEIPGATLNVIGILNPNAKAQHAQEIQTSETPFATQFFLQVLNPCIDGLPLQTTTRVNNLAKTSSKTQILPTYYRKYWQDTPALSSAIESMLVSNDPS